MIKYMRIVIICLITSTLYSQQRFFIAYSEINGTTLLRNVFNPNMLPGEFAKFSLVVRDSEDLTMEHALFDHHHYYARPCERPWISFDLQIDPFYTYLKTIKASSSLNNHGYPEIECPSTQLSGANMLGQINIKDFYLRANTALANITTHCNTTGCMNKDSFTGFDDMTLKAGYDWFFCNEHHHLGLYTLGGIPVNKDESALFKTQIIPPSKIPVNFTVTYPKQLTKLGVDSYRIGLGLNTACTLYQSGNTHITWHADAQYACALPRTCTIVTLHVLDVEAYADVSYTPGNFVSTWTALHYANTHWDIELGSSFATATGEHMIRTDEDVKNEEYVVKQFPAFTVALFAKPYIATAYHTIIKNYPLMLGLGIGYEYDKMHTLVSPQLDKVPRAYNAFQGITVWGNMAVSF